LYFGDPPEIFGRGTFGLVLLAEYRGTQVTVKRAITPRTHKNKSKMAKPSTLFGIRFGDGCVEDVDANEAGTNSTTGSMSPPPAIYVFWWKQWQRRSASYNIEVTGAI
jgi:hypothetical protein